MALLLLQEGREKVGRLLTREAAPEEEHQLDEEPWAFLVSLASFLSFLLPTHLVSAASSILASREASPEAAEHLVAVYFLAVPPVVAFFAFYFSPAFSSFSCPFAALLAALVESMAGQ